jgi:hypothetical protein
LSKKTEREKKIEQFAEWLVTPEEERTIKTQKEFATFLGVEEHTLGNWKKKLAETDGGDEIERFKKHLYSQAMRSGATAKHMELYAKLKGLFDSPDRHEGKIKLEGGWAINVYSELQSKAREYLREKGYNGYFDRNEIIGLLHLAKEKGWIEDFKEPSQGYSRFVVTPEDKKIFDAYVNQEYGV